MKFSIINCLSSISIIYHHHIINLSQKNMTSKMSAINLKGTAEIIKEFLYFAINSILYQRGIYSNEKFEFVKKYGLSLLETTDPELKKYLNVNLNQLKEFLLCRNIDKLAIEITNVFTKEAVEKWTFCIECDRDFSVDQEVEADTNEIQNGIRSVLRQIIATTSVLPFLEGVFTFDMLLYTDKNTALPSNKWEDAKPQFLGSGEQLKFPTVATGIHNVGTMVAYKVD